MFEEALESYDGVPQEERAILVYLVGELWRRIGNVDKASHWFDLVAERDNRSGESTLGRGRSVAAAGESQGMVRLE